MPLSRKGKKTKFKLLFNVVLIFTLSGLWHGANWTYITWGLITGLFIVFERIFQNLVKPHKYIKGVWMVIGGTVISFILYMPSALFFRAATMKDAFHIAKTMLTFRGGNLFKGTPPVNFYYCIFVGIFLFMVEFFQEYFPKIMVIGHNKMVVRFTAYIVLLLILILIGVFNGSQFIYFQF